MGKKTRFAALLLSLSFAASLAACGGTPPEENGGNTGDNGNGTQQTTPPVTPDTAAPVLTLGTVPATMTAGDSIKLEYSATDNVSGAADIRFEVKILNASNINVAQNLYNTAEKKFTPTSAGKYKIVVEAYDAAGNCAKEEREITVTAAIAKDTAAPLITFDLARRLVLGESLDIVYSVLDDVSERADIKTEVTVKTQSGEDVTEDVYDEQTGKFTPTAIGTYSVTVTAYDEANNKAEEKKDVVVYEEGTTPPDIAEDETLPVIQLGSMPGTMKIGDPYTVQFTVTDNVTAADDINVLVAVKDESDGNVAGVYNADTKAFTPTVAGVYKIVITATDEAGNTATKTHTVTVTVAQLAEFTYPAAANFGNDVFVHDPSVFYDEASGRYYAFGSHFAVASSADLITWRQDAADGTGYNTLYGTSNWRSVLSQADAAVGGTQNTWAPDVEKIGNKYYMYYSLTGEFGKNKSVIGRVSSDNILGPYANEELILQSGGSGQPNCIDPELFYDKDGKLWMVYGSFYAGIYIKELYTQTENPQKAGLPKEVGWGTLLWKGNSVGVEGPFVFYAPETDYYYLMVSDGNLRDSNSGQGTYNMRVARCRTPNGQYEDIAGNQVAVSGGGNKLAGNYQFSEDANGYGALGHNSVIQKDGKYFNVYHARKRENTDQVTLYHNLQVNQLFFNEDGWPVMAPNRYAKESLGKVTADRAAGDYDVVVHTTGTVKDFVTSSRYTFARDGKITSGGTQAGSWSIAEDYYITFTLNGIEYKGVIAPAWCTYRNTGVLSITATSAQGGSVWANAAVPIELPNGVSLIQKIDGNVKAKQIDKFTSTEGFAVSLSLDVGTANDTPDWKAVVINSWGMAITLPNLDPYNNVTSTRPVNFPTGSNLYPTANGTDYNKNGSVWDAYLNKTSYVTVSVSTANGVSYYRNGVLTQQYPLTAAIGSKTVKDFIDVLIDCVKESGFMLADGSVINAANNLLLTSAVTTDAQALAIYNAFGS